MAEYTGAGVTIYYVDGQVGNDANTGLTSVLQTWKTIQHAFDKIADGTIVDGDEVRIMSTSDDETYYDLGGAQQTGGKLTVTWNNSEVLITGANSSGVVDGTVVTIFGDSLDGTTPMMEISVGTVDSTQFANLKFDANDTAQHCVEATASSSHHVMFVNCRFTQATSHGVYTNNLSMYWNMINCRFDNNGGTGYEHQHSNYGAVHRCLFDNNAGDGSRHGTGTKITDCVFFNNGDDGCYMNNSGAVICNCVFDNNTGDGLYISGQHQSVVMNCLFTNNTAYGLRVGDNTETRQYNCAFYNNGNDSYVVSVPVHLSMFNYLDDVTTTYGVTADFDFTHNGDSSVVGAGMPTHYKWMGATASDIGLGKWVDTESISIF